MRWMRSRRKQFSTVVNQALEASSRRGEAHRRHGNGCPPLRGSVGWVGGVHPSAPLKARTAASDGQRTFTRAARSAGLRFAVILLSKALDVGRDHLIHRKRSPFPYEGKDLMRSFIKAKLSLSGVIRTRHLKTRSNHVIWSLVSLTTPNS